MKVFRDREFSRCREKYAAMFPTRNSLLLLFLLLITLKVSVVCATDIYVDAILGSDLNGGTSWVDAKQTLTSAVTVAAVHDTLHAATGVYADGLLLNKSLVILGGYPSGGGTRDPSIHSTLITGTMTVPTVKIAPAITGTEPVMLDGFFIMSGLNGVEILSGIPVIINQCNLQGNFRAGLKAVTSSFNISMDGVNIHTNAHEGILVESTSPGGSVLTVTNSWINDNTNGVSIKNCRLVLISNNLVGNNSTMLFSGCEGDIISNNFWYNDEGLRIEYSNLQVVLNDISNNMFGIIARGGYPNFDQNIIHDNSGTGIHLVYNIQSNISSNLIYNNSTGIKVGNISETGFLDSNFIHTNKIGVQHFGGGHIQNCFIANNEDMGIMIGAEIPVINNSIEKNGTTTMGSGLHISPSLEPLNPVVANNIFSNNYYGVYESAPDADVSPWHNNFYMNAVHYFDEGSIPYTSSTDINDFVTNAVQNIEISPEYAGGADYHLSPTSGCINMGLDTIAPAHDIDGQVRPFGGGTDIGADEEGSLVIPSASITGVILMTGLLSASIFCVFYRFRG